MELGQQFATALAAKDFDAIRAMLHPEIDFRALTPSRTWQAGTPAEVVETALTHWFEPTDHITQLLAVESGQVVDAHRVRYRLAVTNADGDFEVEQQAYFTVSDGQIGWMRVLCSGYRRTGATAT